MRHLALVRNMPAAAAANDIRLNVVEPIYQKLIQDCSSDTVSAEILNYGSNNKRAGLYFENNETGASFRILFDATGEHKNRQGIHYELSSETDVDDIYRLIEDLERDGFDTIWLHAEQN